MNIIKKWLEENGIEYTGTDDYIEIPLEKDCTWVNGLGQSMKYDKRIGVSKNQYNKYYTNHQYEYYLTKRYGYTGKQKEVIEIISKILGGEQ